MDIIQSPWPHDKNGPTTPIIPRPIRPNDALRPLAALSLVLVAVAEVEVPEGEEEDAEVADLEFPHKPVPFSW